jgi:hypothetical protein
MSDLALRLRHVSLFVCRGNLVYAPAMCFTRKVLSHNDGLTFRAKAP